MRAVRLDEIGAPENLKIVEKSVPDVGPDDVLIKVELAGLIYGDAEARRGTYYSETVLPWFPGREAAGVVAKVGANVKDVSPGERVMALWLGGGCCAEYVTVSTKPSVNASGKRLPPADIVKLPDNVRFAQGLVYLVNFRLAHLLLHGSSKVPQGETILIQGASGGMGSMIAQLAHAHGCEIIGTCRKAEEVAFLKTLGVTHAVNVSVDDYAETVRAVTDGKGVRFAFNGVGGDTLQSDAALLAPFGELQAYGYVAGKKPFDVFGVSHSICLKTFAADDFFPTPMFPAATAAMHEWLRTQPLLEVNPILPLEEAAKANRMLDNGEVIGKLALKP